MKKKLKIKKIELSTTGATMNPAATIVGGCSLVCGPPYGCRMVCDKEV